jgi:hypothetical protein
MPLMPRWPHTLTTKFTKITMLTPDMERTWPLPCARGGWPFLSVAGRAGAGHTHSCYRGHGHEISGLALHLLQVSLVYVNTLLIQQILGQSDWQNRLEIEDLRALSPLIYAHVNPYGRFELNMETRFQID